ncbi:MAG TPA: pyridoxamine 5'-phosphate oxidase family protein [Candidatus Saccharibacteria bacterium]|jgi:hypothetical protein|nr:pyridoxamine 5'-phosphate oxidase family protein [Candidatus Saccharibacteria bacterium]
MILLTTKKNDSNKVLRIKRELTKAGMTSYGQLKMSTRYLPELIHSKESILGVVYGRSSRGNGMLVATDKRIIYVERRPFFSSTDEIGYNSINGVRRTAALFSTVSLHSRQGDYTLKYVNPECARKFDEVVESYIEKAQNDTYIAPQNQKDVKLKDPTVPAEALKTKPKITKAAEDFIATNDLMVLSTLNKDGTINSVVVNYVYSSKSFYILTKNDTQKAHNLMDNKSATILIYSRQKLATLEILAGIEVESDPENKKRVFDLINIDRPTDHGKRPAPIAQLDAGGFIIFHLEPVSYKFSQY